MLLDYILEEETLDENILVIADLNLDQNIDVLDILEIVNLILNQNECYIGITETDSSGNLIGSIDNDDWCEFEFNNNATDTGFGLNPSYPNPVTPGDWGPFENSYQICYQYSTPYDDTWSNLNPVNINILDPSGDMVYTYSDNYANGQVGICAYIADSLVISSIYRMIMVSGEYECHGDIQFNQ